MVFKFNYASSYNLYVNGKLLANGTSGSPIYFTSYRDDSVGGNTNGGSAYEEGQPGDWRGIYISGADPGTGLDYCVLRYGGYSSQPQLTIYGSAVAVNDCTVSDGNGVGISITGSSSGTSVTDGVSSDNASDGLQISGCAPVVTGNVISDNAGVGVYISGGIPTLAGNTISGNG